MENKEDEWKCKEEHYESILTESLLEILASSDLADKFPLKGVHVGV